jgi:hypothetical protein
MVDLGIDHRRRSWSLVVGLRRDSSVMMRVPPPLRPQRRGFGAFGAAFGRGDAVDKF